MKATHRGTCQWCEAVHKVHPVKGTLANHGYKVIGGYFEGICLGSDKKPFERDCEIVKQSVSQAKEHASKLEKEIRDLSGEADSPECYYHHYFRNYKRSSYRWVKVTLVNSTHYDYCGQQHRLHAGLSVDGDLLKIATHCNHEYIKELEKRLAWFKTYIQRQSKRLEGWEVKPLISLVNSG